MYYLCLERHRALAEWATAVPPGAGD
jgi:hypothetical protein